jgi:hypothetical protein
LWLRCTVSAPIFANGAATGAFAFAAKGAMAGSGKARETDSVQKGQEKSSLLDWHKNRNDLQECPNTCANLDQSQYWEEGQAALHGGDKGYFTYRGNASETKGYQCTYETQCTGVNSLDVDIQRIDHPDYAGTYDYIPPTKIGNTGIWNPLTVTGHFFVDVLPYRIWGN